MPYWRCLYCEELLEAWMTVADLRLHPECGIRAVVGSGEHQLRIAGGLPCGPECHEMEESLSRRNAAKLAAKIYFDLQRQRNAIHNGCDGYVN